eukprot:2739974-Pleurochrysis_carterae.AAC.1
MGLPVWCLRVPERGGKDPMSACAYAQVRELALERVRVLGRGGRESVGLARAHALARSSGREGHASAHHHVKHAERHQVLVLVAGALEREREVGEHLMRRHLVLTADVLHRHRLVFRAEAVLAADVGGGLGRLGRAGRQLAESGLRKRHEFGMVVPGRGEYHARGAELRVDKRA